MIEHLGERGGTFYEDETPSIELDDTFRIFEQNIRRDVHNCVTRKIVRGKNVIRSKVINVVANDRSIVATFSSFVAVIMIKNNEYRRIFSRV